MMKEKRMSQRARATKVSRTAHEGEPYGHRQEGDTEDTA